MCRVRLGRRADRGRAARPAPAALSVASSQATGQAAWAVLPMGARSGPNEFWQLFLLPGGTRWWKLETPPDIATNGAPALAGLPGAGLVAGVRPSLYLAYSPVSATVDGGRVWTAGPPAPGLASVPDALAAAPGGALLSLSRSGQVSKAAAGGSGWAALAGERPLAATPAGARCGLVRLTAVAYSPAGIPLTAGACTRPGIAGIFGLAGSFWRAAGPRLPGSLAGQEIQVLRLAAAGTGTAALLEAGNGGRRELIAGWLSRAGRWTLSPALDLGTASVSTTGLGPAGAVAVVLSNGRGEICDPAGAWQRTPAVPAGHDVVIALPSRGAPEALAAAAGTLTIWRLSGTAWTRTQAIRVPIQYGSSS